MATPEIIAVDPAGPDPEAIGRAADLLRQGQIVVSATDTIYTVNVDATNVAAIERLYALKGRPPRKPIHVVVADLEMAARYAEVTPQAHQLARTFLPGALTLVLSRLPAVPDALVAGLPTLGIRMPDNLVSLELARVAGLPYTTTGANMSDGGDVYTVEDVLRQFGPRAEQIALILDQGPLTPRPPSTLIDLTGEPPRILRQGPIPGAELLRALGYEG